MYINWERPGTRIFHAKALGKMQGWYIFTLHFNDTSVGVI